MGKAPRADFDWLTPPVRLVLAADHAGRELKDHLVNFITMHLGWPVDDLGTHSPDSVDYPDYAVMAAKAMQTGQAGAAILVCGSGIGICMAANRFAWVRAALCRTVDDAEMARKHNNANVLCLGGRVSAPELAEKITEAFFTTAFEGGRHASRVLKFNT